MSNRMIPGFSRRLLFMVLFLFVPCIALVPVADDTAVPGARGRSGQVSGGGGMLRKEGDTSSTEAKPISVVGGGSELSIQDKVIAGFTYINGTLFVISLIVLYRVITVHASTLSTSMMQDDQSITNVLPNVLLWCGLGITLIMFNKYMYLPHEKGGFGFPCPMALTWIQMLVGVLMTNIVKVVRPDLMKKAAAGDMTLRRFITAVLPIGIVFAAYLSIGNSAYIYLSVAFIQMLKSGGPVAVHLIASVVGLEHISVSSCVAVFIIAAGVCGASVGEISFSWFGFCLQFAAFLLDGCRLVMLKNLMTDGNALGALDGLYYYMPVCALALAGPVYYFEGSKLKEIHSEAYPWLFSLLLLNGLTAFALNFSMMMLMKRASATTISVASVIRDLVLTFGSAMHFHTQITLVQVLGYLSACMGVKLWDELKARPQVFEAALAIPLKSLLSRPKDTTS